MFFSGSIKDLVQLFSALPGVGSKSAQRMCSYILKQDKSYGLRLSKVIKDVISSYKNCTICNILTQKQVCPICSDENRDQSKLCVVENSEDVFLIEQAKIFNGYYFVLGKLLSPLEGVGVEDINLDKLLKLLSQKKVSEIIFAINPTSEGETTISYLSDKLKEYDLTRLATGLPFGGDLHYTTPMTIASAIKGRLKV